MRWHQGSRVGACIIVAGFLLLASKSPAQEAADKPTPPEVGQVAEDFELPGLDGKPVALGKLTEEGPVVLVVLRGWPGYQCPICTKQLGAFAEQAKEFVKLKATVLLVYPGPVALLEKHAEEFIGSAKLPPPFVMVIDPDYKFVDSYGLRWNAPGETAYPATFVMDKTRKVTFRQVSKTHGDRAEVEQVLAALRGS